MKASTHTHRWFAAAVTALLADGANAAAAPSGPVGPAEVFSLGAGLVLVVGAILLTGWIYSRTQKLRGGGSDGLIRVIASQPLGGRERVLLLQVADKQLLVGMTSTQVQTLHVFDEPVAEASDAGPAFGERLRAALKGTAT